VSPPGGAGAQGYHARPRPDGILPAARRRPQLLDRWAAQPRTWNALLTACAFAGAAWIAVGAPPADTPGGRPALPHPGFPAPDFTLETADGVPLSLSDLRGRVVLLNIWASWCPPCRAEMPALDRVQQALGAEGLTVLGIHATDQDSREAAAAFLDQTPVGFPVVYDLAGDVGRAYRVRALPTTFIIDRRGVIREVLVGGPLSEAALRSAASRPLDEAP
jgi:cytochrome c biogenesis protein CcmG, thiol:disulfide interchange protein DsbE